MIDVFDNSSVEGIHLHKIGVIADDIRSFGEAVISLKQDMAASLAENILNTDGVFKSSDISSPYGRMIRYDTDVIVLTMEQYQSLRVDAFNKGVKHGMYTTGRINNWRD